MNIHGVMKNIVKIDRDRNVQIVENSMPKDPYIKALKKKTNEQNQMSSTNENGIK